MDFDRVMKTNDNQAGRQQQQLQSLSSSPSRATAAVVAMATPLTVSKHNRAGCVSSDNILYNVPLKNHDVNQEQFDINQDINYTSSNDLINKQVPMELDCDKHMLESIDDEISGSNNRKMRLEEPEMFDYNQSSASNMEQDDEPIKCSAVHTLERDMPDFDYSNLVNQLRQMILNEYDQNEGVYSMDDIEKCQQDDWFLSRFLLRHKLDIEKAFDMLKRTLRYKNESLAHSIRREDFPAEFYKVGGLFDYEEDRKGNKMLYIRVKIHKKITEIQLVFQAFLYYNIQYVDQLANGRGMAIVLDCSGAGLANADLDMLKFLVSTLVNYFPKGLSYILVHELPWILKPFWHLAKAWIAEEQSQLIKFSNSRNIFEYIDRDNLPDFMGGTCKRSYNSPPENCTSLEQAAKLYGIDNEVIKKIMVKFGEYLPKETLEKMRDISNDDDNGDVDHGDNTSGQDSDQENRC